MAMSPIHHTVALMVRSQNKRGVAEGTKKVKQVWSDGGDKIWGQAGRMGVGQRAKGRGITVGAECRGEGGVFVS